MQGLLESHDNLILDGFPRTYAQALALDEMCNKMEKPIDMAVNIHVPDDEIIQRITARLVCSKLGCPQMYNLLSKPPMKEGICDECGSPLEQRVDDTALTVRKRLKTHHERALPILDYYNRKGLLINMSGMGDEAAITQNLICLLEEKLWR
jgi:adenylate kinase